MISNLSKSNTAFQAWRATSLDARLALIERLRDAIAKESGALAGLCHDTMGKPIDEAQAELRKCQALCDHYITHSATYLEPKNYGSAQEWREPLGPILGIMPWNYPVWQVCRFAIPTMIAGNVVLLSHAPIVQPVAVALARLCLDAGFPDGVFQAVEWDVPTCHEAISHHIVRGVSVTGSTQAGRAVAKTAGDVLKPVVLELGGSDPYIVCADADIELAAKACVTARFLNAGQTCVAAKRWIVNEKVAEDFLAAVDDKLPTEPMRLARADLCEALHKQVAESVQLGATCVRGGRKHGTHEYEPTILMNILPDMPVYSQEVFGPVASVFKVSSDEAAIELANDTAYGLGAAVFSQDHARALQLAAQLEAGVVAINTMVKSDPAIPFGGIKNSGIGRELGPAGIDAFTNRKIVMFN